ncbi:MAG: TMEM175 family protein [Pseudomonadota bacterium]
MQWTDERLAQLPVDGGVRMRGEQMTRLETFTDAAFAFAVTLLVIMVDDVPSSYAEFMQAMLHVPAFLVCFCQMMIFWWGHHVWSRRYGMEGGWDVVFSLMLVATVLVFVYPMRVIFGAFLDSLSDGYFANQVVFGTFAQLGNMFVIYGIGFSVLAALLVVHFVRAYLFREALRLNAREVLETKSEIWAWSVVSVTGAVSALLAFVLEGPAQGYAPYVYYSLVLTLPAVSYRDAVKRRRLTAAA